LLAGSHTIACMKEHAAGSLQGKVVLITGAARRIGRALALGLAAEGASIAITYRASEREAEHTMQRLLELNVDAIAVRCDVRDVQNVEEMVLAVVAELGGIDVLINNAGVFATAAFDAITPEQWDEMFATNTRGPFLVSRAALPYLRRRRGRIIHIGSLGGLRPWSGNVHYCASKAALVMLTQAMAKALAPHISVNCVAPGMISAGENRDPAYTRAIARKTPMKRAGTVNDVLDAVLFFASATHFVTGQTLAVDGGLGL
jgi:NAD(P)-dependent dehydrogenase (short-subunit alcohol dehydrogenase family)